MRLLADMELFVAVATLRHFGRAAAALNITASTLSRRLTALERELGISLIRRSTRSFALTESGQQLFERSKKILEDAACARDELTANFRNVSGHLRVGSPFDLVITILAPLFARYCRENSGVSIDVLAAQSQPDLTADSLDVAFVLAHQNALPDSSFAARPIGSFPRMMYASKLYLKRRGTPKSPQHLQGHACLRHLYLLGSSEKKWELHQGRKHETIAVHGPCTSNSVIVAAQAAREHLGVVMLPQHLASHPAFGAGLVRVLPDWEGAKAYVFALSANRAIPAKTQELIRLVKASFSTQLAHLESVHSND